MLQMKLALRRSTQPHRSPSAFYLAGSDPAQWLQKITCWQVAQETLRLYPLPAGHHSLAPQGVLVTSTATDQWTDLSPGLAVPFGLEGSRLYLPIEAVLEPPLTPEELDDLLQPERTYVWHPAIGLVVFESSEGMPLANLLRVPRVAAATWDLAKPGVTFAKHLIGLRAKETIHFQQILRKGRGDIGTWAHELDSLPRSPDESRWKPIRQLGKRSLASLANLITDFTRNIPGTATDPTWIDALENWAQRLLTSVQHDLETERYKEISRLLSLLAKDPDRGLRYAIPCMSRGSRGVATPRSSLQQHSTDFDLRKLSGGQSVDGWNLPRGMYASLRGRYRLLADRELQLGRHRRAAYIFAQLLGEDHAAANALRAGRHYHEAAVMYRDRLKYPLEAANCLEQGGLLTEAAEIFEKLNEHERLGDLLRRLQQNEAAEAAYRRAVEQHHQRGEYIQAAELCEGKLKDPDAALIELKYGWPHSSRGMQCLRLTLQILERHGRHEAAHEWVEDLGSGRYPLSRGTAVAELLADLATKYLDPFVRLRAEDATRRVVARQLRSGPPTDPQPLLNALARLAPEDRLLARDCQRYQQRNRTEPNPATQSRSTGWFLGGHTVQLKPTVTWQQAIVVEDSVFAAGFEDRKLVLGRCARAGENWECVTLETTAPPATWAPILLAFGRFPRSGLLVHVVGNKPIAPQRVFPGALRTNARSLLAGGFRGISAHVVAATCTTSGVIWLIEEQDDQYILNGLSTNGSLLSSHGLPGDASMGVPKLVSRNDELTLAIGKTLFVFEKSEWRPLLELPHPIESLVTSIPNTRNRSAVTGATGGMLVSHEFGDIETMPFATEMETPLAGFIQSHLIAVNETCLEAYELNTPRLRPVIRQTSSRAKPIAVLPAASAKQFMVLTEDGVLTTYGLN